MFLPFFFFFLYLREERHRKEPSPLILSEITAQPLRVPLDWFDPIYWNTALTLRQRADYVKNGAVIALPPEEFCQTLEQCDEWKGIPEREFMEKYGNVVLAQYHIPTDEELRRWEEQEDIGTNFEEVEGEI
jgi:hypothetical protein